MKFGSSLAFDFQIEMSHRKLRISVADEATKNKKTKLTQLKFSARWIEYDLLIEERRSGAASIQRFRILRFFSSV